MFINCEKNDGQKTWKFCPAAPIGAGWVGGCVFPWRRSLKDGFSAGPLYDQFPLTLESGHRTEAVGPFFYQQERDTEKLWGVPPLFSRLTDPATESEAYDLFYPLLTYEIYGRQYRWQFCQLLSFAGGPESKRGFARNRFTLFPLYFQQRSPDTNENYTALVPFYGHLKDRLFRDEIFFVMFPIYSETTETRCGHRQLSLPLFRSAARRRVARLAILAGCWRANTRT